MADKEHGADKQGLSLRTSALLLVILVLLSSLAHMAVGTYLKGALISASAQAKKPTVILDAGHGGEDCGAIGASGVYEKDLNFLICAEMGKLLRDAGCEVVYTRTEDKLLYSESENIKGLRKIYDLKNRCKIAAEYENPIFVSIHMNSFGNSKYWGLQVYYSENEQSSRMLAENIQSSVRDSLQTENKRVIKPGRDIYLLENLSVPAVMVECGFLSNPTECQKLSEKEYQKQLSFSIVCGIIEYMNKKIG